LAKILGEDKSEWYVDFKEGFQFDVPAPIDFARFGFFALIGFTFNSAITQAFGGDLFWGWSTGACLTIPATLLTLFRPKRPTRADVAADEAVMRDFSEFASKRLIRFAEGKRCAESKIVIAFRRSFAAYRTEDGLSSKKLRKIIRTWVGYKTNIDGDYLNIDLPNRKKEAEAAVLLQQQIMESRRAVDMLLQQQGEINESGLVDTGRDDKSKSSTDGDNTTSSGSSFGEEFMR
jgi:hypothetical protein